MLGFENPVEDSDMPAIIDLDDRGDTRVNPHCSKTHKDVLAIHKLLTTQFERKKSTDSQVEELSAKLKKKLLASLVFVARDIGKELGPSFDNDVVDWERFGKTRLSNILCEWV